MQPLDRDVRNAAKIFPYACRNAGIWNIGRAVTATVMEWNLPGVFPRSLRSCQGLESTPSCAHLPVPFTSLLPRIVGRQEREPRNVSEPLGEIENEMRLFFAEQR